MSKGGSTVATRSMAEPDVHAHAHAEDLAPKPAKRRGFHWKSARAQGDACARVIPDDVDLRQEDLEKTAKPASRVLAESLLQEAVEAMELTRETAENSDFNREPMTAVAAWKQVAPGKGEAGNWVAWTALTAAGLARALIISLAYGVALCAETRVGASVIALIFITAVAIATLAGHTA
jgi:hypothetical protein